jgi:anti-repressor protein
LDATKDRPESPAPPQLSAVIDGDIGGVSMQTVNARALRAFLEVGATFRDRIARRVSEYGFEDGRDFRSFLTETPVTGRPAREYRVSLGMAKELAMVERNEPGRQVRLYFIAMERRDLLAAPAPDCAAGCW